MKLPPPAARRQMHTRTIHCEGFVRDDGLWDIEARMVDNKAYVFNETVRGRRDPGDTVHDMSVRLTMDDTLTVREIAVSMDSTPYRSCSEAAARFQGLVGLQVGPGWRNGVNKCVGSTRGCTHVRELLFPMATVAFQTVFGWPEAEPPHDAPGLPERSVPPDVKPPFIDGCHAWASDGAVVAELFPKFSTRPKPAK